MHSTYSINVRYIRYMQRLQHFLHNDNKWSEVIGKGFINFKKSLLNNNAAWYTASRSHVHDRTNPLMF